MPSVENKGFTTLLTFFFFPLIFVLAVVLSLFFIR